MFVGFWPMQFLPVKHSHSIQASLRVEEIRSFFQSGNQLPKHPDPCQVCLLVQPFISDLQIGQIADPTPQRQDGFISNPRVDKLFELIAQTTTQHGVLMPPLRANPAPTVQNWTGGPGFLKHCQDRQRSSPESIVGSYRGAVKLDHFPR